MSERIVAVLGPIGLPGRDPRTDDDTNTRTTTMSIGEMNNAVA
jgi:hypothetical protein